MTGAAETAYMFASLMASETCPADDRADEPVAALALVALASLLLARYVLRQ